MDKDGNVQKETVHIPEEKEMPLKTGSGVDFLNYDSKFRSNEEKTDTFNIKNKTNVCIIKMKKQIGKKIGTTCITKGETNS